MADLIDCIARIKAGLAKLPPGGPDGYQERRKALEELAFSLVSELPKARIVERHDGAKVSFAGVRASSTSGIDGALNNWIAAARRQLDKTGFIATNGEKENVR